MSAPPSPLESLYPVSGSAIPASRYSYDQLAAIYNQTRVDYIVPMPMNAKRMHEYIHYYDIDLDASFVAINDDGEETGIAMLGIREDRSWITRLGIIPARRGNRIGQFLMEHLIEESLRQGIQAMQLEVIIGNEPAMQLFHKLGFENTRELLVIRRPPGQPDPGLAPAAVTVSPIDPAYLSDLLMQRPGVYSWVDENQSMLNINSLHGIYAELSDGNACWLVYQYTPFQLGHFAFNPDTSPEALHAALYALHDAYPMQDTKIENLPVDNPLWSVFQRMGYFEVFRRMEMTMYLR
ncbi:MAG: GNAT family N-acetyltransferase [Armatimonadetes bacterium]|nr:GNAT family N-acetyltransferase [Anaerolineae bacterium]